MPRAERLLRTLRGWDPARVAVSVPLVAAAVRAAASGWIPVGENAVISLRAADVGTANHPWLGTASSVSVSTGASANHPGPLLFDLLALPVKLLGPRWGLVVGVLLLHLVAAHVTVVALRSVGGRAGAWAAAAMVVGLSWLLGPQLVLDPWNPHVLLLPMLAMLASATAVAAGEAAFAPWMVLAGSLVLQVHLSLIIVVPVVVLAASGWAVRFHRTGSARSWAWAAALAGVVWFQPLWQQLFGPGRGNLSALVHGTDGGPRVGLTLGARLVADVVAVPPFWLRPSFTDTLSDMPLRAADGGALPTPGWLVAAAPALVLLAVALGLLGCAAVLAHRRGHTGPAAACGLAICGLAAAVVSAAAIPADGYGVAPHQLRFLWPLALWWPGALAWAAWALWGVRRARARRWARPSIAVAVVLGVLASLPGYPQPVGVARGTPSMADVRRVQDQISSARVPETLLEEGGLWIGEPYTIPVLQALWRNDQPVVVDASGAVQFGSAREVGAVPPDMVLYLRAGAAALSCAPGVARLALVSPLGPDDRSEFDLLQRDVLHRVAAASGEAEDRALLDRLAAGDGAALVSAGADGAAAVGNAGGSDLSALLAEYDAARAALGIDTVAVFVAGATTLSPVVSGAAEAACVP